MSRPSSSPSIQLFPFLAVLVCAMGALILLLLVTASNMRQVIAARARAAARAAEHAARPKPKPRQAPASPSPDELAAKEAKRAARLKTIAEAKRRQSEREAKWQRGVAEAEIALDQRRQLVSESQRELTELQGKLQETEKNLQHLLKRKVKINSELEKDTKLREKVEREHAELSESISKAQKQLAEVRRAHAAAASKFAFIPYDGASGTTRRPLYIECTSTGIRFQPENELLDEADLKGFTETFNPLLVASQRLMQYWREQSVITDDPLNPSRPYVLLLVRPKGTISYYVARKMLSQLGDDFGYELIEDDFPLQLPPADPLAKAVIQRAVADTLKNRGELMASGSRVGEPRLGEVLMGRNDELIEFGTLDDQVAAKIAKDENPFKKNTDVQGKSFTITRSPVQKEELASGPFKSSLKERERRRSQGVPNSLAGMVGRGNGPEYSGPGPSPTGAVNGLAGNGTGTGTGTSANGTGSAGITGTRANGSGSGAPGTTTGNASDAGGSQPRGFGLASNSRPGGTSGGSDTPTGYQLGDPFSRDHLATGRSGAGTADSGQSRGEQSAGDSSGNATSGSSGSGSGTANGRAAHATGTRGTGIPSGAKTGKIIEIPAGSAAFGSGTVAAGSGATGGRVGRGSVGTGRRGNAGDTVTTGNATIADFVSDGGLISDSQNSGTSANATGPRGTGTPPSGSTQPRTANGAQGGVPGGNQPSGGAIARNSDASGFEVDGGGVPGVMSYGTSDDPTAPRGRKPTSGATQQQTQGTASRRSGRNAADGSQVASDFSANGGGDANSQEGGHSSGGTTTQGRAANSGSMRHGKPGNNNGASAGRIIDDEEDNAFRKPLPEGDQPPDNSGSDTGAQDDGQQNSGQQYTRGQRGGMKSRSTNPQVRTYGDNPEARKQLAAAAGSSAASVTQKRESARRRWGGSNTGQIGFERKVTVEVTGDRVIINKDDIEVIIEPGTTQEELLEAVLSALDEHSQEWGKPPTRFYWVPYLHFDVYTSGTKEYERLHGPLRDWGIFSEVDFKKGERPENAVEKGVILPVSESNKTQQQQVKSTNAPIAGPAENAGPGKTPTVKKSPFSWFRRLGTSH